MLCGSWAGSWCCRACSGMHHCGHASQAVRSWSAVQSSMLCSGQHLQHLGAVLVLPAVGAAKAGLHPVLVA